MPLPFQPPSRRLISKQSTESAVQGLVRNLGVLYGDSVVPLALLHHLHEEKGSRDRWISETGLRSRPPPFPCLLSPHRSE